MLNWRQLEALRDKNPKNRDYIKRRNELIPLALRLTKQSEKATPSSKREKFNHDLCFHLNMQNLAYAEGLSAHPAIER